MNSFTRDLEQRLAELRQKGLYRRLRQVDSAQSPLLQLEGREFLNFSSNDYLGLANEPQLKEAALRAIERYGAGAGASRLVCGSLAPHHHLEETIAHFKEVEAALSFSSGFAAAGGAIGALIGKDDILVLDKLVHACVVDAARLSGATLRIFAHNDLNDLEEILQWTLSKRRATTHVLIVTESVFSMDGDQAPLREIVALKERFDAWLMVDEAHATGLLGPHRAGLADALGLGGRIEVQLGTLSKAIGSSGGFLCGSRPFIDYLINRARPFIFSTAPVPAAAAAAQAGIQFIQSEAGAARCAKLWQRLAELQPAQLNPRLKSAQSAIIPVPVGAETAALEAAEKLSSQNIFIPAIRYPTVARGKARLRLTVTASHTSQQIERVRTTLAALDLPRPVS